jgi:endogenous inhibitor of DNA gyrase (YacG/DUF329 family)
MTVKCSTCGTTKFGLIRQRHYFLVFCSRRCKARYLDRLAQDTERIELAALALRVPVTGRLRGQHFQG